MVTYLYTSHCIYFKQIHSDNQYAKESFFDYLRSLNSRNH